jgi:hypothetical protein
MHIGYWWGKPDGKYHWEDQGVGGWTILKWILEKQDRMIWIGLIWSRIGTSEHGDKPSGSIKCWEILE